MMRAHACTGTAVLCALAAVAWPAAIIAQILPALEQYHVRTFEAADGLPAADAVALAQGADGYLYIGGGRGLVRFDGHEFRRIELAGFTSNLVLALHMDARDRLWIVSGANDLGYLENGRLHVVNAPEVTLERFTALLDGSVWFGTANGVVRVKPGEQPEVTHFTRADGIPGDTVNGVFELPDGVFGATSQQAFRIVQDPRGRGGVRFLPAGPRYHTLVDRSPHT
jgi:ligand-binding sensor domain-containing protein